MTKNLPALVTNPQDKIQAASAWLKEQHACSVEWDTRTTFPANKPSRTSIVGARVTGLRENREAAAQEIRSQSPASVERLVEGLGVLASLTATKNSDERTTFTMLRAYAEHLSEYPSQIALDAMKAWPNQPDTERAKWFPTWAELKAVCEELQRPRLVLLAALESLPPSERKIPEKQDGVKTGLRDLAASLKNTKRPSEPKEAQQ